MGAVANNLKENDITLYVVLQIKIILVNHNVNFYIIRKKIDLIVMLVVKMVLKFTILV